MDNYLKEVLEIVKAQAGVRSMTEDEIASMIQSISRGIGSAEGTEPAEAPAEEAPVITAAKAIKEKTITCIECGRTFKLITKKHLASHGLTKEEYLAKHGYKKGTPLVCKALQRERRKTMANMKLWERRGNAAK
jgi:predicted transcriptional regulator